MPQNRRKTPFSGKKKKDQLQQKRTQKYLKPTTSDDGDASEEAELTAKKLMEQPIGRNKNVNRYNLQFYLEHKKDLEAQRIDGFKPFNEATPEKREIDSSYFRNYDFPIRPEWNPQMQKDTLERKENRYFREYVTKLENRNKSEHVELSLFELNLETWRQLWRVLERSDILLIIVDIRYATLMFPPSLYEYIVNGIKKHAILVLNKVDLVAPEVVVAWKHYFMETYPGLPVVIFASFPTNYKKRTSRGRSKFNRCMDGVSSIFNACKKIVQSEVDLSSWEQKIAEDMHNEEFLAEPTGGPTAIDEVSDDANSYNEHVMYRNGVMTLGCIGFPNVGKSTLLNGLKGRKVVSVSRTPGHTKHFQTIFLTKTVCLCDCPGLVFPSSTPKNLQVLLGSYPISQLRVPYPSLKFLGEHVNIPDLLKLHLPPDYDEWSPAAVADAWALKRGFLTAKAARPDRYRAANHLLRMCLAGHQQLILQFYPPDFHKNKEIWLSHPEVEEVKKFQFVESEEKDERDAECSSINSETDSDEVDSASESDADEADEEETGNEDQVTKPRNAFALLEDDD